MAKKKHKQQKSFDLNNIKFFYGIPHCHTSFSTGRGNPLEAYEQAYRLGLNFLFVTDHNSYLSSEVLLKNERFTRFQASKYLACKFRKKYDDFLPLVGFECKTAAFGDLNILNSQTFFTGVIKDFKILALWMFNNPDSFISINHPHKNIKALGFNPILNKLITCIEVGNGNPSSRYTRHYKYYYHLLDEGWKLSAINGQDNHRLNFSDSENLTVYIGNELSTKELISAFRTHRTYSTESRSLKLYFTINDAFMGDDLIRSPDDLKFMIFAEDYNYKIKEIQIVSNKGIVIKSIDNINLNSIKYMYAHKGDSFETWYVIKIIQEGNKVAFTSPIFITSE